MAQKKCENCGKLFTPAEPHHRYCSPACYREATGGGGGAGRGYQARGDVPTAFRFDDRYLKDGYFQEGAKLRPEIFGKLAEDAALALGKAGMTSHQLRLFFNKVRAIEDRLAEEPFDRVAERLLALKRDAVYQVGRGVAPDELKRFLDRNVELAVADQASFERGFIQHLQSVLAYFVYHFRNK